MVFTKMNENKKKINDLIKKLEVLNAQVEILTAQVGDLKMDVKEIKASNKTTTSQIEEIKDNLLKIESKEEEIICGAEEQLNNFFSSQR